MDFNLKFQRKRITELAEKYGIDREEVYIEEELAPRTRLRGYLDKEDFLRLCLWKSQRPKKHCSFNGVAYIKEVTGIALSTKSEKSEQLRIEILALLNGVSWPMASVILHFGYDNLYPILDFRALWSISAEDSNWNSKKTFFLFWESYTKYCRVLASELKISMRVLDRALWQFSKDNQP